MIVIKVRSDGLGEQRLAPHPGRDDAPEIPDLPLLGRSRRMAQPGKCFDLRKPGDAQCALTIPERLEVALGYLAVSGDVDAQQLEPVPVRSQGELNDLVGRSPELADAVGNQSARTPIRSVNSRVAC